MSKPLKFKSFGICNYRSVASDVAWIDKPSRINIIIGQNNAGKSNILKFISRLPHAIKKQLDSADSDFEVPYEADDKAVYIAFRVNGEYSQKFVVDGFVDYQPVLYANRHGLNLSKKNEHLHDFFKAPEGYIKGLFRNLHSRNATSITDTDKVQLATACLAEISKYYPKLADQPILFIPANRGLDVTHSLPGIVSYSGDKAISQILDIMEPEASHDVKTKQLKYSRICTIISRLLTELDIKLVNAKGGNLLLNDSYARLPYRHFGYGIQQLLVMACAIELTDANVICIDEPEIAMHPTLQHRFMRYLRSDLHNDRQFFLSTHSTVFADHHDDVSVYHVTRKADGTSLVPIVTNVQASEMIDDLGIHASDLLQSNAVIWVEGPSDRVLLKKWISLVDPNLLEGIHYSIIFYGGSNLFHHTGESECTDDIDAFVQMLRVNRHSLLFADRDRDDTSCPLKPALERVLNELGSERVWVTLGREIENYIPNAILGQYFSNRCCGEESMSLSLYESLPAKCKELGFSFNKMSLAVFAAKQFTEQDLHNNGLKESVEKFVSKLNDWNKPLIMKQGKPEPNSF